MKENMEKQDTMDNEYGHTSIPPILKPLDIREKYWGKITSVCKLENCTLKIIEMHKDTQSSLEFHTEKNETYYILSGKVRVGIRYGRAENKSVVLNEGDVYHVPKGVMHMRMSLEDSIIVEIASNDTDADSHIVEDGKHYEWTE